MLLKPRPLPSDLSALVKVSQVPSETIQQPLHLDPNINITLARAYVIPSRETDLLQ